MRSLALVIGAVAWTTLAAAPVAAQTDPGKERTTQGAGTSGAATSHSIAPGRVAEPHEITGTATDTLPLSSGQIGRLKSSLAQAGHNVHDDVYFTISVGAAVPKQIPLQPWASGLADIVPTYKGDQYVVVRGTLVIATPDRRIVAVVPGARG